MKLPALLLALLVLGLVASTGIAEGTGEPVVLSGHVIRGDGTPFPGVNITFSMVNSQVPFMQIRTDANGNFNQTLSAGSYNVSASIVPFYANVSYAGLSSSSEEINFTMYEILGAATGHVTNGNSTLTGAAVVLNNKNGNFSGLTTAPLGVFVIENITPGTYLAYAEKDGYDRVYYPDPVIVERGVTTDLNFTLQEAATQPSQLSGKVTFNRQPLAEVSVTLTSKDGAELTDTTDSQGSYSFTNVPAGEYTLTLTKSGYVGTSQKVTLLPFKQSLENVSLKKDTLPGNEGFLFDYDLAHSLMIVGLFLSLFTTATALLIRYRVRRRPDLLEKEEEEKADQS